MKSVTRLGSMFVITSVLACTAAQAAPQVTHVSVLKHSCSPMGYCARTSNTGLQPMGPTPMMPDPVRFNAIDGEPIR
jgi:hypothetical protein